MTDINVKHIGELNDLFVEGMITDFPKQLTVDDIVFTIHSSPEISMNKIFTEDKKAFLLYHVDSNTENKKIFNVKYSQIDMANSTDPNTLGELVCFVWGRKGMSMVPYRARYVTPSNLIQVLVRENEDRPVIGSTVQVKIHTLGGLEGEGKIDTGADMTCLHADNIKSSGEAVSFEIDGRRFTMNQHGSVEIQTAGEVEKRPIIKVKISCDGCDVNELDVNLNDRSDMPHKILLGKDFLQRGNFLIDPMVELHNAETINMLLNALEDD